MDFQFDFAPEWPIKNASTVNEQTRECLGATVECSVTGEHLIDELDRLAAHEVLRGATELAAAQ